MIKRDKKPEEIGSWMDTYGDMVTLLLCFFVLLYSMSSMDQQKWRMLVKNLNPESIEKVESAAMSPSAQGEASNADVSEKVDSFDDLYQTLKKVVEEQNIEDAVEMKKGEGYTFISFRDKVFFDGDSSVLRPEGKELLSKFSAATSQVDPLIKEVLVLGHTSQASPEKTNNIRNDRMLSAQRSAEVIIYLQSQNAVSPDKLVGMSFGQFRPIAAFDTAQGRAQNRRVEILITKMGAEDKTLDEYYNQVYYSVDEVN